MSRRRSFTSALLAVLILVAGAARGEKNPAPRCDEQPGNIGYLGISSIYETSGDTGELRVTKVTPGAPAARAGLSPGDVIVAIDGHPLPADRFEFAYVARNRRRGEVLRYTVRRDDVALEREVELAAPPDGWQERYLRNLEHQEIERRKEGRERLARLSAKGPIELTFQRAGDCRFEARTAGAAISLPLTLAAGLRIVPLLDRLHPEDSFTLEVHVSGNTMRIDSVRMPTYLSKRDIQKAIQETARNDEAHFQKPGLWLPHGTLVATTMEV